MSVSLPPAAADAILVPYPSPILRVEELQVYQGSHLAVDHVSFELLPGTDTAVVGPNGAGKSTLIQAILGLLPIAAGRVEIFGRPLAQLGARRRWLGYVPQTFVYDRGFPLQVIELVGLGWQPARDCFWQLRPGQRQNLAQQRRQAIAQALERVGVWHLRHQPIGNLSGGELKRVLLAYCLVRPRKLLLLDEAVAGIDVQAEADFYQLLEQLQREQGWTILQVSHDLEMVSRHCDRVLCLNRRLVCQGKPDLALSPQSLLELYGPAFGRYYHQH